MIILKKVIYLAFYNENHFCQEVEEMTDWSTCQIQSFKAAVLDSVNNKRKSNGSWKKDVWDNCAWKEFLEKLKTALNSVLPVGFVYPDIRHENVLKGYPDYKTANDVASIKACLDAVRGKYIEMRMESFFLQNQTVSDNENYLARIYSLYWRVWATKKDIDSFLLLCAQLLLTGRFTRSMMSWVIAIHAKMVLKGGISDSLNSSLCKGDSFDKMKRSTLLEIAYALRNERYTVNENISRTETMLVAFLGKEGYDPRSFLEMIYYYASVRGLKYQELKEIIVLTAKTVLRKLLPNTITTATIENFVDSYDASKNQNVETLLNLSQYGEVTGVLNQVANYGGNWKVLKKYADEILDTMNVREKYDPSAESDTYQFLKKDVNSFVVECSDSKSFVDRITEDRHFYVTFCADTYVSVTQTNAAFSIPINPIQQAAVDIYWCNFLWKLSLKKNETMTGEVNGKNWKSKLKKHKTREERKALLREIFDEKLMFFRSLNMKEINRKTKNSEVFRKARSYAHFNTNTLYDAILDEVERDLFRGADREMYLYHLFEIAVNNGDSADAFVDDIDDNSELEKLRWKSFDAMDYHDIYLYMCLNTNNPLGMFEELNSTTGYEYHR